ncbi:MAG: hypothetical protein ACK506_04750, partial [Pirellula sp.]
ILATFLCTLQPGTSGGEPTLIAKLQHSILGSWLAATQMGFAPTCLQTISSTHVHRIVRHLRSIRNLHWKDVD